MLIQSSSENLGTSKNRLLLETLNYCHRAQLFENFCCYGLLFSIITLGVCLAEENAKERLKKNAEKRIYRCNTSGGGKYVERLLLTRRKQII